ncbi:cell division protein FtsQ/DivIB [Chelativorans sp. M5D2P16]|uniref:cell division protein FtsQ/DivIB n=1 Tax=Chelativorans sp. M5D2P16 TaxID=3095678 RepID=UPI002ACAE3C9|nr:cell division protein FtsQ/DivIB [Chelativorans sp. M5D2P16]MDZ5698167.1 cell division protein FtsQ/DivIB [Chelativorans sp. M5D2P16]
MFALRSYRAVRAGEAGQVLPRWLRRPARIIQRLEIDRIEPPRFAATLASGLLFALAGLYGGIKGGHMDEALGAVTARAGFAIENVDVSGNRETSEIDVLQQIGLDGWTSMVGFDVRAARARIVGLPWVENAAVRKVYPATVEVRIEEREPFALWQRNGRVFVIERNGDVIAPFMGGHLASLPLVIGAGADVSGPEFIERVSRVRGLDGRVRAYVRLADRRWDLKLDNGMTIKLPEHGVQAALAEASRLDAEYALFSRTVSALDLRLPDRFFVALTPEAAEAREEALEKLMKGARI